MITNKDQELREAKLRIEILEFMLCGGNHEYVEISNVGAQQVCLCKKCHKRLVK